MTSLQEAEDVLTEWDSFVAEHKSDPLFEPMQKTRRTFKRWRTEILNYFVRDGVRYSNASTEALNSRIAAIQSSGRGYAYEQLRIKAIYGHTASDKPKATTKRLI